MSNSNTVSKIQLANSDTIYDIADERLREGTFNYEEYEDTISFKECPYPIEKLPRPFPIYFDVTDDNSIILSESTNLLPIPENGTRAAVSGIKMKKNDTGDGWVEDLDENGKQQPINILVEFTFDKDKCYLQYINNKTTNDAEAVEIKAETILSSLPIPDLSFLKDYPFYFTNPGDDVTYEYRNRGYDGLSYLKSENNNGYDKYQIRKLIQASNAVRNDDELYTQSKTISLTLMNSKALTIPANKHSIIIGTGILPDILDGENDNIVKNLMNYKLTKQEKITITSEDGTTSEQPVSLVLGIVSTFVAEDGGYKITVSRHADSTYPGDKEIKIAAQELKIPIQLTTPVTPEYAPIVPGDNNIFENEILLYERDSVEGTYVPITYDGTPKYEWQQRTENGKKVWKLYNGTTLVDKICYQKIDEYADHFYTTTTDPELDENGNEVKDENGDIIYKKTLTHDPIDIWYMKPAPENFTYGISAYDNSTNAGEATIVGNVTDNGNTPYQLKWLAPGRSSLTLYYKLNLSNSENNTTIDGVHYIVNDKDQSTTDFIILEPGAASAKYPFTPGIYSTDITSAKYQVPTISHKAITKNDNVELINTDRYINALTKNENSSIKYYYYQTKPEHARIPIYEGTPFHSYMIGLDASENADNAPAFSQRSYDIDLDGKEYIVKNTIHLSSVLSNGTIVYRGPTNIPVVNMLVGGGLRNIHIRLECYKNDEFKDKVRSLIPIDEQGTTANTNELQFRYTTMAGVLKAGLVQETQVTLNAPDGPDDKTYPVYRSSMPTAFNSNVIEYNWTGDIMERAYHKTILENITIDNVNEYLYGNVLPGGDGKTEYYYGEALYSDEPEYIKDDNGDYIKIDKEYILIKESTLPEEEIKKLQRYTYNPHPIGGFITYVPPESTVLRFKMKPFLILQQNTQGLLFNGRAEYGVVIELHATRADQGGYFNTSLFERVSFTSVNCALKTTTILNGVEGILNEEGLLYAGSTKIKKGLSATPSVSMFANQHTGINPIISKPFMDLRKGTHIQGTQILPWDYYTSKSGNDRVYTLGADNCLITTDYAYFLGNHPQGLHYTQHRTSMNEEYGHVNNLVLDPIHPEAIPMREKDGKYQNHGYPTATLMYLDDGEEGKREQYKKGIQFSLGNGVDTGATETVQILHDGFKPHTDTQSNYLDKFLIRRFSKVGTKEDKTSYGVWKETPFVLGHLEIDYPETSVTDSNGNIITRIELFKQSLHSACEQCFGIQNVIIVVKTKVSNLIELLQGTANNGEEGEDKNIQYKYTFTLTSSTTSSLIKVADSNYLLEPRSYQGGVEKYIDDNEETITSHEKLQTALEVNPKGENYATSYTRQSGAEAIDIYQTWFTVTREQDINFIRNGENKPVEVNPPTSAPAQSQFYLTSFWFKYRQVNFQLSEIYETKDAADEASASGTKFSYVEVTLFPTDVSTKKKTLYYRVKVHSIADFNQFYGICSFPQT